MLSQQVSHIQIDTDMRSHLPNHNPRLDTIPTHQSYTDRYTNRRGCGVYQITDPDLILDTALVLSQQAIHTDTYRRGWGFYQITDPDLMLSLRHGFGFTKSQPPRLDTIPTRQSYTDRYTEREREREKRHGLRILPNQ